MEAKGCAKPMEWKNARRRFYWALRSQLALNGAISKISTASPNTSRAEIDKIVFDRLGGVSRSNDRAVAESLDLLDLTDIIGQLRSAHVTREMMSLVQAHRKAGLAGLVGVVNALTDEEKAALAVALQGASTSPGK